ncbi:DUF5677 domain-containing protein [Francisella philomiragia]|uniref:Uncharacterized protein n=1 Tax=Francisella philomiragia TaxID=28110 RepID=A0A0B6CQ62_9GAMM|nr:DUF5677 domain-containing protein [Francisella philomiragia]AJI52614.1 hypothetical protein LA55_273 [Francisella philomiragia]
MNSQDVYNISEIFEKQIKVYKEACNYILHTETKYSEELFLLLLGISDSLESILVLSRINKMRDCYALSRMIYETSINILYISASEFKAMDEMIEYTTKKSSFESARSLATDKETVSFIFDGEKNAVIFSKSNQINMKGDPRNWTVQNLSKRINIISKKYGDIITKYLQLAHLTIYRTSSDIIHGTLYGMRYSLGIVNKNDKTISIENMINHSHGAIATLLLTVSQCVYSILYAIDKEIGLQDYEKEFNELLGKLLKKGSKAFSEENK